MQILFTSILLSPSFLGNGFDEQVEGARIWRRSSAHDAKNMDLAQRSLATRVCHEDDSLIFSTGQAALVGEINSFLGLSTLQFEDSTFEPGVLLAVLCILLWNLCIYREFRSIWFVLQGVFLSSGASERPLSGRRAAAMAFVCLGRAAIGGSLLVAGSLWLAGTTSITELMLNSVALEAVLHVDEFIFSGLLPTRLQQQIQELPPVQVRRARRCHRAENLVLASLLAASLLLPYALLLRPLSQQMLLAKRELCFGDLDFVTSVNDGLSLGFVTRKMEDQANQTISEIVAVDLAFRNKSDPDRERLVWLSQVPCMIPLWGSPKEATLDEFARETSSCYSADDDADYSSGLLLPAFLRMAAFQLEQENVTSCQDMEQFCDTVTEAGTLLRMACPRVCGCTDPLASPLLRVKRWGCFQVCIQEAYGFSLNPGNPHYYVPPSSPLACRDAAPGPGWVKFWDGYLEAASIYGGFDYTGRAGLNPGLELFIGWVNWAKVAGCPALLANPVDVFNIEWCRGNPALFRPLAWFCPETCGCSSSGNLERDRFCFGYDHCPVHVAPNDTVAFWGMAGKYDFTKILVVH
ncbi:VPS11 [Symbiodinium sp. CCMP2592]|nr:VPS11 [Symbiodinium sp. CCMP2592]